MCLLPAGKLFCPPANEAFCDEGCPYEGTDDMADTGDIRSILNETTRLANKGTKSGLTAEERRRYEKGVRELRRSVAFLSAKRKAGATSASEDALLDRLVKTQGSWLEHGGKPFADAGKGDEGSAAPSKDRPKEYEPTSLDIPIFSEFADEVASTFGYGSRGDEGDRLSHIIGNWASGKIRERVRDGINRVRDGIGEGVSRRMAGWSARRPTSRRPLVDRYGNVDGLDLSNWSPSAKAKPAETGGAKPMSEETAFEWKRYVEESSPVESGYTRWMDEIHWKIQQAREGDPEMMGWYQNEYPKEAALWYRRMMGDKEQVAKDTREAYSMGDHEEERPAKSDRPLARFGRSVGMTARGFVDAIDNAFSDRDHAAAGAEVWVKTHDRRVNGRRVRVRGHKRHQRRNGS